MNKSDSILVTGAGGLVGSAVVDLLQSQGFSPVWAIERKHCDLRDPAAARDLFERIRPDYVFHSAARVHGILGNMSNQGQSFLDNTLINTSVVDAAMRVGVKKITVMGTGAVYPFPPQTLPLAEDAIFNGRPHPSENAYAHAKRGMLAMLEAYEQSYSLNWAYIVSCNLFGPRDKFDPVNGHVIPSLIRKFYEAKRSGGHAIVWGNGSAQRDFMYVKDAVRAALIVMNQINGIINMGSGRVYRIRDIVEMLAAITKIDQIAWDTTKPNGQDYRAYDLQRLTSTGFKCEYPIKMGLQETWDWYCTQKP